MSTIWNFLAVPNPASGAIPFVDLDNVSINIDVLNFYWNKTAAQLSVSTNGDYTGTDSINSYAQHDQYLPQSQIGANPTTASGASPGFTTSTSRGTGQIPAVNINNDFAGNFSSWIYTGTSPAYTPATAVYSIAKGVSAGAAGIGGEIHIATKVDGGALTDRLVIDNAGTATITGNLVVTGTVSSAALLTGAFSGSFNATLGTIVANGMYLPAGNTLAFSTNTTRNLTIDPSGRVLVNLATTGAGNEAFQVNGAGNISGVSSIGNVNVTLSTIPNNGIYLAGTNTVGVATNGINLMNINTVGVGIGMVPVNILDITQTQNAASTFGLKNASTGTAAFAQVTLANASSLFSIYQLGTGWTTSGANIQNSGNIFTTGNGGLSIGTNTAGGIIRLYTAVQNLSVQLSTTALTLSSGVTLTLNGGTLLATNAALTNGAAAAAGTLTNAPAVGNPTKWIPINDNGTTRFIPAW